MQQKSKEPEKSDTLKGPIFNSESQQIGRTFQPNFQFFVHFEFESQDLLKYSINIMNMIVNMHEVGILIRCFCM